VKNIELIVDLQNSGHFWNSRQVPTKL